MARIAAFLAGDAMDYVKLLKLVYLADRESLSRYNIPISYDDYQPLKRGPVPDDIHQVLERREHTSSGWNGIIDVIGENKADRYVSTLIEEDEAVSSLSDASIAILENVFKTHRSKSRQDIILYTHENCPEWDKADKRSAKRLTYENILVELGRSPDEAIEIATSIRAYRAEQAALARG
jgi:uncharacterized phage-associated protein